MLARAFRKHPAVARPNEPGGRVRITRRLPPSADHEIDVQAAALPTPEPPGPFEQGQLGAVPLDMFGNVGLGVDLTSATPGTH